jgi:GGDEF domain-containing protein
LPKRSRNLASLPKPPAGFQIDEPSQAIVPSKQQIQSEGQIVMSDRQAKQMWEDAARERGSNVSFEQAFPNDRRKLTIAKFYTTIEKMQNPPTWDEVMAQVKAERALKEPDRRSDIATRKKVDEMSPEEMKRELLTSPVTNMPNRRAFDEAEQTPAPAVGMSDADGLKALNDKYGYDAGNGLLKLKAEALREAGLDAYHEKGDEFLYRGQSTKELQSKLEKAREILRNKTITVKMKDGSTVQLKGADFSYGTGKELTAAETGLKSHKSEREARGERARGELRGITQVGSEQGGQHPVRERPGSENKPQEVKTLAGQTPNRDKFRIAYTRHLERAVNLYPDQYGYGKDQVPKVVEKMINALARGSANKDSLAIKATLKELKIKNTKGAISEFLRETQPVQS